MACGHGESGQSDPLCCREGTNPDMGDQDLLFSLTGGVALPASLDLRSLIYKVRGLGLILQ